MHLTAHVVNMCMRAPRMRRHTMLAILPLLLLSFMPRMSLVMSERVHVQVDVWW